MMLLRTAAGAGAAEPGLQTSRSTGTQHHLRCSTQQRHDTRRQQLTRCSAHLRQQHATASAVTAAFTTSVTATRAAAASVTATVAAVHDLLTHVGHQRRSSSLARHQPHAPPLDDLQLQHSEHVRLQQQLAHLHRQQQQQQQLEQQLQQLEHEQQQQQQVQEEEQQHARRANCHDSRHALTTGAAVVNSSPLANSNESLRAVSSLQQQQPRLSLQQQQQQQQRPAAPAVLRMHGRSKPSHVAAALCQQLRQCHGDAEVLLCVAGAELALAALHALAAAADTLQQQEQGRVQLAVVPRVRRSKRPDGRGRCLTFDFACRVQQLSHEAAAAAGDAAEEQPGAHVALGQLGGGVGQLLWPSSGQEQQQEEQHTHHQQQHAQQRHHVLAVQAAAGHHTGHDCVTAAAAISSSSGGQEQQQQPVHGAARHHQQQQQPVLPCCGALAAAGLQQPFEHHANGHAGACMLQHAAIAAGIPALPACCSSSGGSRSSKSHSEGSSAHLQPLAWPGQAPQLSVHEQQLGHSSHQPLQLHHTLPVMLQQHADAAPAATAAAVEAVHVAAAAAADAPQQQQQQQEQQQAELVQAIKVCSTSMNLADAMDGALSSSAAAVTLAVAHPKQAVKAVEAVALLHKRWQQLLPGHASSSSSGDDDSTTLALVMSPCWARGRRAGATKRALQLYVYAGCLLASSSSVQQLER